jgi:quercetin dioxygenase-like cupin family protein
MEPDMPFLTELVRRPAPVISGLHAGPLVPTIGDSEMRVVVPSEATAGGYAVWMNLSAPGASPPRHVHYREDEIFHVLEGKLAIWVDGETYEAEPGDTASLPRGIPHTFRVISDTPARMLMTVVPGGFERFFAAVSGLVVPRDMGDLVRISDGYGLEYVGPPLEG